MIYMVSVMDLELIKEEKWDIYCNETHGGGWVFISTSPLELNKSIYYVIINVM